MTDSETASANRNADRINVNRGFNILVYLLNSYINKEGQLPNSLLQTLSILDLAEAMYSAVEIINSNSVESAKTAMAINSMIMSGRIRLDLSIKIGEALRKALSKYNYENQTSIEFKDLWAVLQEA